MTEQQLIDAFVEGVRWWRRFVASNWAVSVEDEEIAIQHAAKIYADSHKVDGG